LRVLSLAGNIPGPLAAARLHALGAAVCKVEPPGGDALAAACPAWYAALHAGQAVIRLDLKDAGDRAQLDPLLAAADLLITASPAAGKAAAGTRASRRRAGRRPASPRRDCRATSSRSSCV
jgi:crotonobetainyl-CoA:carnitine CoA-transferase CaiB-like acyl-CoA transferase